MLRWLATIALVAVAARPVSGQERKDTVLAAARESRPAAMAGVDTLRTLAKEHYATLGFSDAEQAAGATLGEPLVEFFVRLDSLQAFSNPRSRIAPLRRRQGDVPVLAGQALFLPSRSSGQRRLASGRLRGSTLAGAISQQRINWSPPPPFPGRVLPGRVPALGLIFSSRFGGTMMLTPLLDDPKGRWKTGATSPQTPSSQLVADAKASGLPM
jgi:hypothetical protein